jgi:hypothetical protein
LVCCVFGCLVVCLVGWLVGWLVGSFEKSEWLRIGFQERCKLLVAIFGAKKIQAFNCGLPFTV